MVGRRSASALLVVGALATAGFANVGANVGPDSGVDVGQVVLRLPGRAPSPAPSPAGSRGAAVAPVLVPRTARNVTYTVKAGDNLTGIAARFNVTATALSAFNGISRPNLIRVGQVLKIPVPSPAMVQSLLVSYSKQYKVDPALVEAVAWQESGWQQQIVSDAGAIGVMQLMPGTGQFTGQFLLQRSVDPAILDHNIQAGVAFFAYLLRLTGGDVPLALAGYYQGLRSVKTKGLFDDTKRYVANVVALRQRFSA